MDVLASPRERAAPPAATSAAGETWLLPGREVLSFQDWGLFTTSVYERGEGEGLWRSDRHRLLHGLTPRPAMLLEIDGRPAPAPVVRPETVAIYPAGAAVRTVGGSSRYAQLCWGVALYRRIAPDLPRVPEPAPLLGEDPLLGQLMRSLVAEIGAGTLDRLLAESMVAAIAMRAAQRHGGAAPDIARPRLRRVLDHIEAHLGRDLSLEELAGIACLSPCHLSRSFKAAVGVGPQRYVMRRRVERAKALLLQTGLPLAAVAADLGFADQSHFTNVFRREAGTTPARFREGAPPHRRTG